MKTENQLAEPQAFVSDQGILKVRDIVCEKEVRVKLTKEEMLQLAAELQRVADTML